MPTVRQKMQDDWKRSLQLDGRFWESAYDARRVRRYHSLATRIAYDHNNPVKQNMCRCAELSVWSSASEWPREPPGAYRGTRPDSRNAE